MSDRPISDQQTMTPEGVSLRPLPDGLQVRDAVLHVDERGSICEMFDPRWDWHPDPLVYSYFFTIRPGMIKGWGLHERHEDRYFVVNGDVEIVLYDERPESPSRGLVAKVYMSEQRRQLVNIPAGVWHASRNIGTKDLLVVNFPTLPYEHAAPDKLRLPLDTDRIPYRFENASGW